jgi:thiol-disulfide isomerase/thioredoxin
MAGMEQKIILGIVGLLVVGAVGLFFVAPPRTQTDVTVPAGTYTAFAQCIKDSGTLFYGAFWCPHCLAQKKLFGDAAELLPYIECSTPDKNGQLAICKDAGVSGYPTWEFPDKTRQTGEIPLATLAEKTGCTLPAR